MAFTNKFNFKRLGWVVLGILAALFVLRLIPSNKQDTNDALAIPYSAFVDLVHAGRISEVEITPSTGDVAAQTRALPVEAIDEPEAIKPVVEAPGTPVKTPKAPAVVDDLPAPVLAPIHIPPNITTIAPPGATGLIEALAAQPSTVVRIVPPTRPSAMWSILTLLLPVALLILFWYWMMKRQPGGGMGDRAMGFGKNRSQMVDPASNPIRLSDVAGCDEAKQEVAEIVDFLRRPEDYQRVGAEAPRGILMVGAPGTGKTLLAKAIAGEAGVPFFSVSGSDFVEMFVGVGAARVRSLFEQVKQAAPAIVFIDEIDAVGKQRSGGQAQGANDERDQTLNQLLVEMDGFQPNSGVVVIAATNRADVLDAALRRPGRFDREVVIPLPDRAGRAKILALHAKKVPIANSVDWERVARGTPGFSGADLANLINEAALIAARTRASMVTAVDLENARDKIILGVERKGGILNDRERRVVAYHEAGHALVARFLSHTDPVHKITIMPRGRALGVTMQLPQEDSYNQDAERLRATIAVLLGGRAAEEVALSTMTVGASNDFDRATQIARRMVGVWGMSKLGAVSVHGEDGENQWGTSGWSNDWKLKVDNHAVEILTEEFDRALHVMRENSEALERVAQALLERETLDADEFEALIINDPPKDLTPA
jgi:cell division protease FtsH